ncbi:MAG: hypothetical protein Q4P32_06425, partial [Micrococcales bacterium]|nr:hypothetical protein [Micrococcales bacterium]
MRWLKIGAAILFLPLIVAAALVAGPIVGVVWGVRQFLPSRVPAGRRGRGGTAIVVSAVFALVAWPVLAAGLGGTGETQAAAPTSQDAPASATASASSTP